MLIWNKTTDRFSNELSPKPQCSLYLRALETQEIMRRLDAQCDSGESGLEYSKA